MVTVSFMHRGCQLLFGTILLIAGCSQAPSDRSSGSAAESVRLGKELCDDQFWVEFARGSDARAAALAARSAAELNAVCPVQRLSDDGDHEFYRSVGTQAVLAFMRHGIPAADQIRRLAAAGVPFKATDESEGWNIWPELIKAHEGWKTYPAANTSEVLTAFDALDAIGEDPIGWQDSNGPALHAVSSYDRDGALVEYFISKGADVHARAEGSLGKHYGTPLHNAAAYNNERAAEILMAHGARDVPAPFGYDNPSSIRPSEVAAQEGNTDVAELIVGKEIALGDSPNQNPEPDLATGPSTGAGTGGARAGCSFSELDAEAKRYIASRGPQPSMPGRSWRYTYDMTLGLRDLHRQQGIRCNRDMSAAIAYDNRQIAGLEDVGRSMGWLDEPVVLRPVPRRTLPTSTRSTRSSGPSFGDVMGALGAAAGAYSSIKGGGGGSGASGGGYVSCPPGGNVCW